MKADGGFVSQFMLDEKFDRKHFLINNRIIVNLHHATVLIQPKIHVSRTINTIFAY